MYAEKLETATCQVPNMEPRGGLPIWSDRYVPTPSQK